MFCPVLYIGNTASRFELVMNMKCCPGELLYKKPLLKQYSCTCLAAAAQPTATCIRSVTASCVSEADTGHTQQHQLTGFTSACLQAK